MVKQKDDKPEKKNYMADMYEKVYGDKKPKFDSYYREEPSFFYVFLGRLVVKSFMIFILSFPLAWVVMKATPENIRWANYYAGRYLQYFASFVPSDIAAPTPKQGVK